MGPAPLPPGLEVTYHRLCLGGRDGGNFATWANFSETVLGGRAPARSTGCRHARQTYGVGTGPTTRRHTLRRAARCSGVATTASISS